MEVNRSSDAIWYNLPRLLSRCTNNLDTYHIDDVCSLHQYSGCTPIFCPVLLSNWRIWYHSGDHISNIWIDYDLVCCSVRTPFYPNSWCHFWCHPCNEKYYYLIYSNSSMSIVLLTLNHQTGHLTLTNRSRRNHLLHRLRLRHFPLLRPLLNKQIPVASFFAVVAVGLVCNDYNTNRLRVLSVDCFWKWYRNRNIHEIEMVMMPLSICTVFIQVEHRLTANFGFKQ